MTAVILNKRVRNARLLHPAVQAQVLFERGVLHAAGHVDLRQRALLAHHPVAEQEQVVRLVLQVFLRRAEGQEEVHRVVVFPLRHAALHAAQRRNRGHLPRPRREREIPVAARGIRGHLREAVAAEQADLERAVAAHRQPGHEALLPRRADAEHAVADRGHLLRHIRHIPVAVFLIRIRAQMRLRHHDGQVLVRRVALHGRAPLPDGVIVRLAVQQIEHGEFLRLLPCAVHADALCPLRQDHADHRLQVQGP